MIECILAIFVTALLIIVVMPENPHTGQVPSPRTASANNLYQIGIAMRNFVDDYGVFPPAAVYDEESKPLYSWRVLLLPYLEEGDLYSQFKLKDPWDSPNNWPLLAKMPQVYKAPTKSQAREPYVTYYQVFTGGGSMFQTNPQTRFLSISDISDGPSKTLLVVEAADPVPWTKPEDLPYSPKQPLPKLGGLFSDGFNVLTADGRVHRFPKDLDEKTIRGAITWNGGEAVNLPD
jgi:hypothetical protein